MNKQPADPGPVIHTLAAYRGTWAIAGGWAIDFFLGRKTRAHADTDVAVFRDEQSKLRASFPEWEFRLAINGELVPWESERVVELPLHEIHALTPLGTIEFLLNERRGDDWVYRRDSRIQRPLAHAILWAAGVPVLAAEIVLLYKSKDPRPSDSADLANAAPHLSADARAWLTAP